MDSQMRMHRLGAFITYRAYGGTESIEQFYPLKSDKQPSRKVVPTGKLVTWEEIMKSHNIK